VKVGCHLSIQGGIEKTFEKASELGCETFQLFTQNQRQWVSRHFEEPIRREFSMQREALGYSKVKIVAHASYLINLCASDNNKLTKSRNAFLDELKRCDSLGIDYIVIHPGAHGDNGEDWGISTIAESLNSIFDLYQPNVKVLLESIAGQGTGIGYRFEHLNSILSKITHDQFAGICLDTCHMFAAGYEVNSADGWNKCLDQINANFGTLRIGCIHLNDSKYPLGSKKDRHAAIGEGFIGLEGFRTLMNIPDFVNVPGILEVPGGEKVFYDNLRLLKSFRE
jgi:deoxyribonuclease-4